MRFDLRRGAQSIFFLLLLTSIAAGQGARVRPESRAAAEPDHPKEREAWFLRGRVVQGEASAELLYRAHQQKMANRAARLALSRAAGRTAAAAAQQSVAPGAQWLSLGPAPLISNSSTTHQQDYGFVSGRATAVVVDPNDPTGNTVYLGGAFGGLWKSTNTMSSPSFVRWDQLLNDQATQAVGAIAVHPSNSSIVLVGTGEAHNSADSYYGLGILRSVDGGASWNLITSSQDGKPFRGLGFSKIAFGGPPDSTNWAVAAAAAAPVAADVGGEITGATTRGLYYSHDAGMTWTYATVYDAAGSPEPGSATSVVYNPARRRFYAALRYHGLYSSPDGITWTRLPTDALGISLSNCPSSPYSSGCPLYRAELAVVPDRDEMYVWVVDTNDVNRGLYRTTDGGNTWQPVSSAGIEACGDSMGCGSDQGTYNLSLAAVPNGTATDLYAGAVNLYRCTISDANPDCVNQPFVNLTHVYGCNPLGSFSLVHPDQHALAVARPSTQVSTVFVANDGGIYRIPNGYVPTNGACGGTYTFDNLNQTLGSMTQFVWFAQHPTDLSTLLGGTQDNGSPAVDAAHSGANGTTWTEVSDGDGAYSDINPTNPSEWFTAYPYVSIQRCPAGINCNAESFVTVVSNTQVGGDSGPFYTPFLLDPSAPSRLIVGTCRVWRGPSSGLGWTGANALSYNFDTLAPGMCSSAASNMIRALAAGGPVGPNGSKVIYGGTMAGRIFVTTDADLGPTSWVERTGPVNPGGFPISSIAIDPSDATGQTAYVTIMGFTGALGTGHLYKTTNAGQTWTSVSGAGVTTLPDAPADAVVVDPTNSNYLYVGTDLGVFGSTDAGATWTEVGPASGAGAFPNVAVTNLRIFDHNGTRRLRAATHGRGLWEIELLSTGPDFRLGISHPQITAFPDETKTFTGTLTAINGYASPVDVSCDAGGAALPEVCQAASVTPTVNGAQFSITVRGHTPNGYAFRIKAVDGNGLTRQESVQFDVVDFLLGPPSPAALTVPRGRGGDIQLDVTPAGPFRGSVTVSCEGLPAGATCLTTPSAPFHIPQNVHFWVNVPNTVAAGSYNLNLTVTTDGPHSKSQAVPLTITLNPDFLISEMAPLPASTKPGRSITTTFTVASQDGFAGTVNIACQVAGMTCSANPPAVSTYPTVVQIAVNVPMTTAAAPTGSTVLAYTASSSTRQQLIQSQFRVMDYAIQAGTPSGGSPGGTISVPFTIEPRNGFADSMNLQCESTVGSGCTVTPQGPISLANGTVNVSVSVPVASNVVPGTYTLKLRGTDATYTALAREVSVPVGVMDFAVAAQAATATTIRAGGSATYNLTFTPTAGANGQSLSLSCSNLPSYSRCVFVPAAPAFVNNAVATATVTIYTTAASAMAAPPPPWRSAPVFAMLLPFPAIGLVLAGTGRRKRAGVVLLVIALAGLLALQACGGGSAGGGSTPTPPPPPQPGTPAGTYSVIVTAASQSLQRTVTLTLVVQ